eukprot:542135_1
MILNNCLSFVHSNFCTTIFYFQKHNLAHMETYGSIPSMDVIMKDENKKKNRCCIFCCVIVIIFIGLAGWTMTTWNFIKPNTLYFNDIWTSIGLKNEIVNELNHTLAIKAE